MSGFDLNEAVRRFLAVNDPPGCIIERRAFCERVLGLPWPDKDAMHGSVLAFAEFERMRAKSALRDRLLRDHNIDLVTINGKGVMQVAPREQATFALEEARTIALKTFGGAALRAECTNMFGFTDDDRRRHRDAAAKIAASRNMFDGRRREWRTE